MPVASTYLSLVAGPNGKLDAIGGTDDGTVEEHDPATDTWTAGNPLSVPRDYVAASFAGNGRIYAIGGRARFTRIRPTPTPTRPRKGARLRSGGRLHRS
jgi:hypothetical protein